MSIPAPYIFDSFALVNGSHEQRVTLELTDGETLWAVPLLGGAGVAGAYVQQGTETLW